MRIEHTGGMLPPWETLRHYPTLALYSDGRLITLGPQVELYPGPALPNLQVTQLTQRGVAQVLEWSAQAGLEGPDRTLGQELLDGSATLITVVRDGATHQTRVWDMAGADPETAAVREFQEVLLGVRAWLGDDVAADDTPYAWDRLRIISVAADPGNMPDPDFASVLDWPLAQLATLGIRIEAEAGYRCALIDGADLAALRPLLERANDLTLWRSADALYEVRLHPLLPTEEACPGL